MLGASVRPDDQPLLWQRSTTLFGYRNDRLRDGKRQELKGYGLVYGVLRHQWGGKFFWQERKSLSERRLSFETGLDRRTVRRIWKVLKRDNWVAPAEPDGYENKLGIYRNDSAKESYEDGSCCNVVSQFCPLPPGAEVYRIGEPTGENSNAWDKFPRGILRRRDISERAKKLFILVCSLKGARNGQCRAKQSFFAQQLRCHQPHVTRYLAELSSRNIVHVEYRYTAAHEYDISIVEPLPVACWSPDRRAIKC